MKEFSALLALLFGVSILAVAGSPLPDASGKRKSMESIPVYTSPPTTCPLSVSDQCLPLKLLTWNVNLMTSYDFFEFLMWWFGSQDMNDPEMRAQEIAHYMSKRDYHIVSLQELGDQYLRDVVNEGMRQAGYYMTPVLGEVSKSLNAKSIAISDSPVSAEALAGLIARIKDNTISGKIAKQVFEALWNSEGKDADEIIEKKGLKQVTDTGAIESMIDEVLAANAQQVENYRAAPPEKRGKMIGFFVGQAMKASKGKANPGMVNQILKKKLDA